MKTVGARDRTTLAHGPLRLCQQAFHGRRGGGGGGLAVDVARCPPSWPSAGGLECHGQLLAEIFFLNAEIMDKLILRKDAVK